MNSFYLPNYQRTLYVVFFTANAGTIRRMPNLKYVIILSCVNFYDDLENREYGRRYPSR